MNFFLVRSRETLLDFLMHTLAIIHQHERQIEVETQFSIESWKSFSAVDS